MKFNSTNEAMDFGKNATKDEVEMMWRIRKVLENQFYNIMETDESDEGYQMMSELATQAQLMREAAEASKH
jgi:hypothetical protein